MLRYVKLLGMTGTSQPFWNFLTLLGLLGLAGTSWPGLDFLALLGLLDLAGNSLQLMEQTEIMLLIYTNNVEI